MTDPRVETVKAVAKAICASIGPKPHCLCNGNIQQCIAIGMYQDFAIAALLGAERAGYVLIRKEELDALQGRGRDGIVRGEDRSNYGESISRITNDGAGAGVGTEVPSSKDDGT